MIAPIFMSLRPKQWTKNIFVFAALLFSEKGLIFNVEAWLHAIAGFFTFCGISGCVYLLNDIVDLPKDRIHPKKCLRPLPSGQISITEAKAALLIILIISLFASWSLSPLFFAIALTYFMINLAYSFKLKNVVIIDVMCIASGFVLRAAAGVTVLQSLEPGISISHWLILATFMLAMFLGLAKRRQEIINHSDKAVEQRSILSQYSPDYIDQMTSILATIAIITYTFYTVSPETTAKFGTNKLVYTVPAVLYGMLRYLFLIHMQDEGESPSDLVLKDHPLQLSGIVWVVLVLLIIHFKF